LKYVDPSGYRVWLIHGTWANPEDKGYSTWTPEFVEYVGELFNESVKEFDWTGKNKKSARLKGAETLTEEIYDWHTENPDDPIRIVGHSHGGNVGIMTADLLAELGMSVETLITIATPVREYKLTSDVGQHIHMYNNLDITQKELGGRWRLMGLTFTRKFKGADNVRAKDGEVGFWGIDAHSTMHSSRDIWIKYVEPLLR